MASKAHTGLRFGGGTAITRCCGAEAITPYDPDADYLSETDDGTPITTDEFPDADYVCPRCERTWPPDCEHDEIVDVSAGPRPDTQLEDGKLAVTATCLDCGNDVAFYMQVADVEVLD